MWEQGKFIYKGVEYRYSIKRYDTASHMGINNGRISKLDMYSIQNGIEMYIFHYDRGWDFPKSKDKKHIAALNYLLKYTN